MDIQGQKRAVFFLTEALKQQRLSPSLLFVGSDTASKTRVALELAKTYACVDSSNVTRDFPRCNLCRGCQLVEQRNHADLLVVTRALQAFLLKEKETTQTAIKIESVRQSEKFLSLKPLEAKRRTVLIEEAELLNTEAANALLKTLEEPPNNAQIILSALHERTLPTTVVSRCAVIRFNPAKTAEPLDDGDTPRMDLADYRPDEFFEMVNQANWRKDSRKNAESALKHLIESASVKLNQGDAAQLERLDALLQARNQINRNVPPKLALENLYVTLHKKGLL